MAYKSSSDKIFIKSNQRFTEEAPLLSVASSNKDDSNILPGMILVEDVDDPNSTFGVKANTVSDTKTAMLIAIENAELGGDIDQPYVSADSTSAADFAKAPRVQYMAAQSGDIVQLRNGDADAIEVGDLLSTVGGGTAGSQVNGCVQKTDAGTEANVPVAVALEAQNQTNANDKSLIRARII